MELTLAEYQLLLGDLKDLRLAVCTWSGRRIRVMKSWRIFQARPRTIRCFVA